MNLTPMLKDSRYLVRYLKSLNSNPLEVGSDITDKALNFKVTKYVQWIANFGI